MMSDRDKRNGCERGRLEMAEKMEKKDFSIEESLKKIEAITAVLENPATSLKDSLAAYAEGVQLVQACKMICVMLKKK